MTHLVICRGLPASGKTTWAQEWVAEDQKTRARVNKDDLRRMMHAGVYLGHHTESQVNLVRDRAIGSLLRKGIDVVSDDTNLPQPVARDLARIGHKVDPELTLTVKDFTHVSLDTCLQRDEHREHSVGARVIIDMHERFIAGKKSPLPWPEDKEHVSKFAHYERDPNHPSAWMVDIDGTLALMDGRGPFEWHRVGEDAVNVPVVEAVAALVGAGNHIILMSGRDSVCRRETEDWLEKHGIFYTILVMRPEGDSRNDAIIKHELFWEHVAPHYAINGVLDDRDRVVKMWREIGLPCFQVAPGNF